MRLLLLWSSGTGGTLPLGLGRVDALASRLCAPSVCSLFAAGLLLAVAEAPAPTLDLRQHTAMLKA